MDIQEPKRPLSKVLEYTGNPNQKTKARENPETKGKKEAMDVEEGEFEEGEMPEVGPTVLICVGHN